MMSKNDIGPSKLDPIYGRQGRPLGAMPYGPHIAPRPQQSKNRDVATFDPFAGSGGLNIK